MSTISLTGDGSQNATILPNIFIEEYMKDANDAQIKVYLYLLRMMQSNTAPAVSDMADLFNHTEKDVIRALMYWEKRGVLALEYAPDGGLCGIRMLRLSSRQQAAESVFSQPSAPDTAILQPEVQTLPRVSAEIPANTAPVSAVQTNTGSFSGTAAAVCAPVSFEKPVYSLDQLKVFKEQENTAQLIFIAEQYLGRTLSPADMKSLLFFSDVLHFSDDLIDYLLQYCVERGKKDFRYIEKVAIAWAEANVTTPAEAQGHASRYDRTVYAVMNALGKTSTPTRNEVAYILRWSREYGFDTDVILEACGRTVLATDKHRFAYADSILTSWYKAGVHHVSDISGLDASFQKDKAAKPARTSSAAEYNRFMHSNYDFDALEQALLQN